MSDHHELCLLYESGELPAEQRVAFERHADGCPSCRELLAALGAAHRAAGLVALPAPAGLGLQAPPPVSRRAGVVPAVFVAASLAVLASWPRGATRAPSGGELDRDLAALGASVERLGADLALSETDLEIDADLGTLERKTRRGL